MRGGLCIVGMKARGSKVSPIHSPLQPKRNRHWKCPQSATEHYRLCQCLPTLLTQAPPIQIHHAQPRLWSHSCDRKEWNNVKLAAHHYCGLPWHKDIGLASDAHEGWCRSGLLLKEAVHQKWKFRHFILTPMPMENRVKCHCPQNIWSPVKKKNLFYFVLF